MRALILILTVAVIENVKLVRNEKLDSGDLLDSTHFKNAVAKELLKKKLLNLETARQQDSLVQFLKNGGKNPSNAKGKSNFNVEDDPSRKQAQMANSFIASSNLLFGTKNQRKTCKTSQSTNKEGILDVQSLRNANSGYNEDGNDFSASKDVLTVIGEKMAKAKRGAQDPISCYLTDPKKITCMHKDIVYKIQLPNGDIADDEIGRIVESIYRAVEVNKETRIVEDSVKKKRASDDYLRSILLNNLLLGSSPKSASLPMYNSNNAVYIPLIIPVEKQEQKHYAHPKSQLPYLAGLLLDPKLQIANNLSLSGGRDLNGYPAKLWDAYGPLMFPDLIHQSNLRQRLQDNITAEEEKKRNWLALMATNGYVPVELGTNSKVDDEEGLKLVEEKKLDKVLLAETGEQMNKRNNRDTYGLRRQIRRKEDDKFYGGQMPQFYERLQEEKQQLLDRTSITKPFSVHERVGLGDVMGKPQGMCPCHTSRCTTRCTSTTSRCTTSCTTCTTTRSCPTQCCCSCPPLQCGCYRCLPPCPPFGHKLRHSANFKAQNVKQTPHLRHSINLQMPTHGLDQDSKKTSFFAKLKRRFQSAENNSVMKKSQNSHNSRQSQGDQAEHILFQSKTVGGKSVVSFHQAGESAVITLATSASLNPMKGFIKHPANDSSDQAIQPSQSLAPVYIPQPMGPVGMPPSASQPMQPGQSTTYPPTLPKTQPTKPSFSSLHQGQNGRVQGFHYVPQQSTPGPAKFVQLQKGVQPSVNKPSQLVNQDHKQNMLPTSTQQVQQLNQQSMKQLGGQLQQQEQKGVELQRTQYHQANQQPQQPMQPPESQSQQHVNQQPVQPPGSQSQQHVNQQPMQPPGSQSQQHVNQQPVQPPGSQSQQQANQQPMQALGSQAQQQVYQQPHQPVQPSGSQPQAVQTPGAQPQQQNMPQPAVQPAQQPSGNQPLQQQPGQPQSCSPPQPTPQVKYSQTTTPCPTTITTSTTTCKTTVSTNIMPTTLTVSQSTPTVCKPPALYPGKPALRAMNPHHEPINLPKERTQMLKLNTARPEWPAYGQRMEEEWEQEDPYPLEYSTRAKVPPKSTKQNQQRDQINAEHWDDYFNQMEEENENRPYKNKYDQHESSKETWDDPEPYQWKEFPRKKKSIFQRIARVKNYIRERKSIKTVS